MTIKHSRIRNTYINKLLQRSIKFFFLDKNGTIKNKCVLKIVKTIGNVKILQFSSSSSSSLFSIILS